MSLFDFRAICMPYCLKQQEDGSWLVLNREYVPLSFNKESQDYRKQDLPIYTRFKGLTPKKIEKIISIGKGACVQNDGKDIFLYGDGSNPFYKEHRKDYFKRLEILMDLEVDHE